MGLWWQGPWVCERMVVDLLSLDDSKEDRTEIGFVGRSNVGKSSLINALLGGKYAYSSKTPGRTRGLVFFDSDRLRIVDMPGYGYAEVSRDLRASWQDLIRGYLEHRRYLREVYLLIDIRRGLQKNDEEMLESLDSLGILYNVVLTKSDKVSEAIGNQMALDVALLLKDKPAFREGIERVSSHKGSGISKLRLRVGKVLHDVRE